MGLLRLILICLAVCVNALQMTPGRAVVSFQYGTRRASVPFAVTQKPPDPEEVTKKFGLEAGLFSALKNKDKEGGDEGMSKAGDLLKRYGGAYLLTSIRSAYAPRARHIVVMLSHGCIPYFASTALPSSPSLSATSPSITGSMLLHFSERLALRSAVRRRPLAPLALLMLFIRYGCLALFQERSMYAPTTSENHIGRQRHRSASPPRWH